MRIQLTKGYYLEPCTGDLFDVLKENIGIRAGKEVSLPKTIAFGVRLEKAVEKVSHLVAQESETESMELKKYIEEFRKIKDEILKATV